MVIAEGYCVFSAGILAKGLAIHEEILWVCIASNLAIMRPTKINEQDHSMPSNTQPNPAEPPARLGEAFTAAELDADPDLRALTANDPVMTMLLTGQAATVAEAERKFLNELNFNEFIGWLYPRIESDDFDAEVTDIPGDWERRYLARRDDIRNLAFLISEATDAFQNFRKDGKKSRTG